MGKGTLSKVGAVGLMAGLVVAGWFIVSDMGRDRARAAATAQVPPVPVVTDVAVAKDMPVLVRGIGTVQAYETVAVKTRVDGQIVKVAFTEGQFVKAGDLLFQIDPAPLQAVLDHADAAKRRDEAQLAGARLDLERYGKLIGSGYQSRQSYDQQHATVDALTATVALDQATIDTAKVNLAFTDIRAPFDGRAGTRLVDIGNLVPAPATPLVNITRIKPIFVTFTVPQDVTDARFGAPGDGNSRGPGRGDDDKTLLSPGKLTLIDNQIDQTTGTLKLKATFANADERLWPGLFVNVRLMLNMRRGADRAGADRACRARRALRLCDQGGQHRRAAHGRDRRRAGRRRRHRQGSKAGEKVVVEGQYRLTRAPASRSTSAPCRRAPAAATRKTGWGRRHEHLRTFHPSADRDVAADARHPGVRHRRLQSAAGGGAARGRFPDDPCQRPATPAPARRRWRPRSRPRSNRNSPPFPASPR